MGFDALICFLLIGFASCCFGLVLIRVSFIFFGFCVGHRAGFNKIFRSFHGV